MATLGAATISARGTVRDTLIGGHLGPCTLSAVGTIRYGGHLADTVLQAAGNITSSPAVISGTLSQTLGECVTSQKTARIVVNGQAVDGAAIQLDDCTVEAHDFQDDCVLIATGTVTNSFIGGSLQDCSFVAAGVVLLAADVTVTLEDASVVSGGIARTIQGDLSVMLEDATCSARLINPNAAELEVTSANRGPRIVRKFLAYRVPLIAQSEEDATKIVRSVKKKAKAVVAKIAQTKADPELEIPQIIVRGQPDYMARIQAEVDKANAEIRAALQRAEQERDDEEVMMLLLH